jgi:hypothetical protein
MGSSERSVAVAVFPDQSQAEYAVEELVRAGFPRESIGFALVTEGPEEAQTFARAQTKARTAAEVGIAVGGLVGAALAGVVLPVAGTVIARGMLATVLGGAAGGGILGGLIGLSVPENDARILERDFHAGHTMVSVQVDGRYDEAVAIFERAKVEERKQPHHGRGRLEGLTDRPSASDGSGRAFVPEP